MASIFGKIINEGNAGISNLDIVVYSSMLGAEQPEARTTTSASGEFAITVNSVTLFTSHKIRIYRGAKILIYESPSHTLEGGADWDLGNLMFHSQYVSGRLVRNRNSGLAPFVSAGNKIEYHIDNERSWHALSTAIASATATVHLQQFHFLIKKTIFDFNANNDPLNPPNTVPTPGTRLETLLKEASDRNVDVKVIIRDVTFLGMSITSAGFAVALMLPFVLNVAVIRAADKLENIGVGKGMLLTTIFLVSPAVALLLVPLLLILPGITNAISTGEIVKDYFEPLENDNLHVKRFPADFFNPLHAKYTIIDNETVFFTASPFYDGYFGTQDHFIKDYRYGNSNVGLPVHDVSLKIQGDAITALRQTYNLYWNKNGQVDTFSSPVPQTFSGNDSASVQVNRTILKDFFPALPEGEAAVLESYLRAINEATNYIYLENQYLIDEYIYDTLVEKIKNSSVQLIAVVNMNMDIPGYNNTLRERVNAFKSALTGKESQFGFFTIWTHVLEGNKHHLMNNYVHSKVGIVDDKWATVGSANLDEYSLRNVGGHEVNIGIFNGADENAICPLAETLRNKLWNEHLYSLNQDSTNVIAAPSSGGWLSLWKQRANEHLDAIKTLSSTSSTCRLLEWTEKNSPTDYLKALGVENFDENKIKIYDQVESLFDFIEAKWVNNNLGNQIKDFSR